MLTVDIVTGRRGPVVMVKSGNVIIIITSLPYFRVKLSCALCLLFAYRKKIALSYPKVTYSYPKVNQWP